MDTEVSRTLAELERKLHDLELALSSVGAQQREQTAPTQAASSDSPSEQPASGARLVDESVDLSAGGQGHAEARGHADAQGHAGKQPVEHLHRPTDESIELVELVRFRDRLESAMRDLLEDYERIIRLRAASELPPGPIDEH